MLGNLEEMQKAGKMQLDTVNHSALLMLKGAQKMTAEAAEQARDSVERCSSYFERIVGAKSPDEAMRIQSEFATASWERFFAGANKIADTCAGLAREVSVPMKEAAN